MTEPVLSASGQQLYAPGLNGGAKLPMRYCNRCGDTIVWCQSKRTGRYYPANVYELGQHSARKYAPWAPHRCGRETTDHQEDQ